MQGACKLSPRTEHKSSPGTPIFRPLATAYLDKPMATHSTTAGIYATAGTKRKARFF